MVFERQRTAIKQSIAAGRIRAAKARAAGLKEREAQAIRIAKAREQIRADQKIKALKNRPTFFGAINSAQKATKRVVRSTEVPRAVRKARRRTRRVVRTRPIKTRRRKMSKPMREENPFALDFDI